MKRISALLLILSGVFLLSIITLVPTAVAQQDKAAPTQSGYEVEDDAAVAKDSEQGLVSLDFKDADLKDVLKVFSQQSGLNFIASKNIEDKKITLYMNEVLVEDALKTLMDANNLGLEQNPDSNILIVKGKPTPPVETKTRVYKIRYYFGNSTPGTSVLGSGGSKKSSGGSSGKDKKSSSSAKGADTGWDDIVKPLLSEYGSIVSFMNLLIITDVPDRFKLFDQIISEIDKPVPEVMIEVELIETTASFLHDLGIKWSGQFASYTGPATSTPFPYTPWEAIHDFTNSSGVSLDSNVKNFSYGLLSSKALTWILEMLQTDTNTKFLAKPRVLVQDREWAEIGVMENKVVSVKTTINSESNDKTTEAERMMVGTSLRLVPIINAEEGYVSMMLEPTISRPTNSVFTTEDGATNFIDPQERSMRTVVMAKDGETVAIGGFITTEDQETKTKVPWLGDLPLFGALFRHTSTDRVDKELLIFITPRIVNPVQTVDMWVAKQQPAAQQPQAGQPASVSQSGEKPSAGKTAAAPEMPKKDLSFREQEDVSDMKLDLTVKSSSLGVVDLVK
jgi:Type II secretory pathway, component PulD